MTNSGKMTGYCAEQVRKQDHDRFQTVLFAPADKRDDLFAIYAFNQELAKIRETVSEPMLGEIRLQWWREAIDEIYGGTPRKHEVVEALAQAVGMRDLPRELFDRMIDARTQDIYDESPRTMEELSTYLENTSGNLARLAAVVLGGKDEILAEAAGKSGLAWGMIGIIRAVPYHLSLRKTFLPTELLARHGLSGNSLAAPENREALSRLTAEVCGQAERLLGELRTSRKVIPSGVHSLFLLNSLSRSYLKSLRKAGYSPFSLQEKSDAFARQCRLMVDALFKRV
ncbi:phytoene/squalene synthase family protein [Emcibacter sp.]|uniref:phytoene/squalene synthase family protein n=1 Tax=Emcibacter sp. TaxID=1979954 RepID=UPI003A8D60AE